MIANEILLMVFVVAVPALCLAAHSWLVVKRSNTLVTRLILLGAGAFAPVLLILFNALSTSGMGSVLTFLAAILPGLWFTVPATMAWIFDIAWGARLSRAAKDGFVVVSYLGMAANIMVPFLLFQPKWVS